MVYEQNKHLNKPSGEGHKKKIFVFNKRDCVTSHNVLCTPVQCHPNAVCDGLSYDNTPVDTPFHLRKKVVGPKPVETLGITL